VPTTDVRGRRPAARNRVDGTTTNTTSTSDERGVAYSTSRVLAARRRRVTYESVDLHSVYVIAKNLTRAPKVDTGPR